ncbi:hypothetical protein T484DRAFT_1814110 [Baffinella frigidus]|nr:hypothetical protein T484DRAFT_1814110 [Cryptophyta sp. CCMP2293]
MDFASIWATGQPDNAGNGQNCGAFGNPVGKLADGKLYDQDCGEMHPYICQIVNMTANEMVTVSAGGGGPPP